MTVFVIQKPRFDPKRPETKRDLMPAAEFGPVAFVFEANWQSSLQPAKAITTARRALKDFSDDDYMVWAGGDPASLAIATGIAADINQGRIKWLRYERPGHRAAGGIYVPVELRLR